MKKNVFLIIITVLTVICIIGGTFHHFGVFRKDSLNLTSSIKRGFKNGGLHFDFSLLDGAVKSKADSLSGTFL